MKVPAPETVKNRGVRGDNTHTCTFGFVRKNTKKKKKGVVGQMLSVLFSSSAQTKPKAYCSAKGVDGRLSPSLRDTAFSLLFLSTVFFFVLKNL